MYRLVVKFNDKEIDETYNSLDDVLERCSYLDDTIHEELEIHITQAK